MVATGSDSVGGDTGGARCRRGAGRLEPSLRQGAIHTGVSVLSLTLGIALVALESAWSWVAGQLVLGFFFAQVFVLLHEAGHNTLFPRRRLNRAVGHLAGFFALIPFWNWQRIHARHHRYTGWQDLDATTASLVPRAVAGWERAFIDSAWFLRIPVFAVIYRVQNFWYLPRIRRFLENDSSRRRVARNTWILLAAYAVLVAAVGPLDLLAMVGPGFVVGLAVQEVFILSQHTHVPQQLSGGRRVRPFAPVSQQRFTRSLRLPNWLAVLFMRFNAHELHHMFPQVPGYRLGEIAVEAKQEVDVLKWIRASRRVRGTDYLFRNWDDTGIRL